jgi:hypothetical protein
METIDRKFRFLAINPCNGNIYTEKDALILCAKDRAVPAALKAYLAECTKIRCNNEHLRSIGLLIQRVEDYQHTVEVRTPDTVGECEISRCLDGEGVD